MARVPVVKIENAHKVYRLGSVSVNALRGVSLEADKGEFIVIMGPSGSGKTTLMNLIGALDQPTKGRVYIDGRDLTTLKESELTMIRRNKVGFVFQFYNLLPVLTALENVELSMLIAGVPKREREARARELLDLVGLGHRANHRPDELSGGEQQRVAIARALSNRPSIILADEPTGDLDTKSGMEVIEIMSKIAKQERATVIAVTHDPLVTKMATRLLSIRDGMIIEDKRLVEEPESDEPILEVSPPPLTVPSQGVFASLWSRNFPLLTNGLGVGLSVVSYILLIRLDTLVNNTLYQYGLWFDLEWITPYWTFLRVALAFLAGIVALKVFSSAYIIFSRRVANFKGGVPIVANGIVVGMAAAAIYFLYQVDTLVNSTLIERYGLLFNTDWVTPFWTLHKLVLALLGCIIVANIFSSIRIKLGI